MTEMDHLHIKKTVEMKSLVAREGAGAKKKNRFSNEIKSLKCKLTAQVK